MWRLGRGGGRPDRATAFPGPRVDVGVAAPWHRREPARRPLAILSAPICPHTPPTEPLLSMRSQSCLQLLPTCGIPCIPCSSDGRCFIPIASGTTRSFALSRAGGWCIVIGPTRAGLQGGGIRAGKGRGLGGGGSGSLGGWRAQKWMHEQFGTGRHQRSLADLVDLPRWAERASSWPIPAKLGPSCRHPAMFCQHCRLASSRSSIELGQRRHWDHFVSCQEPAA